MVGIRNGKQKDLTHSNHSLNGSHHCYYYVRVRSEIQSDCGWPQDCIEVPSVILSVSQRFPGDFFPFKEWGLI